MLFNDSIELECNDSAPSPEPLPMNWDIDLTKVCIPDGVLPNRKRRIDPNENKPFVLYTLEKPDFSNAFSVYSDECPQYHGSQTLSVSSEISHCDLRNEDDNLPIQQALSSQNTVEWDARLDIGSGNVISPNHLVNYDKPNDSLRDSQETYNSLIRNAVPLEKKALDAYSVQETSYKASLEDLNRRMAEILSENEPFRENWHHEDVIKSNQVATGSTLDSIPLSVKDSLEELYYSDEDENQFAEEYEHANLEIESPVKKPKCIYTENSYVQEQPSESFVDDLEQAKNSSSGQTVPLSFGETEKIQLENQKEMVVGNACGQKVHVEQNGMEFVYTKDSEQELLNYKEDSEDSTEKVPELPIAYKRPPLQGQTNKTKPQKEKKKAKKAKINIPLKDLFQSSEANRFNVPEVDEFYLNLVHQGKCEPLNQETISDTFPSINLTEELQTKVDKFPSINLQDKSKKLFWDPAQSLKQNLSNEPQSDSTDEIKRNEEKAETELESKEPLDILVIDNIPLNVSKPSIKSFILGFGEFKNLKIERHRQFQRAKLQMDSTCEINWIIECLNGSQPFGSSDKVINCYRQT